MTEPIENHRLGDDDPGAGWASPDRPVGASGTSAPPEPAAQGGVPTRITLPPGIRPIWPPTPSGAPDGDSGPEWGNPSAAPPSRDQPSGVEPLRASTPAPPAGAANRAAWPAGTPGHTTRPDDTAGPGWAGPGWAGGAPGGAGGSVGVGGSFGHPGSSPGQAGGGRPPVRPGQGWPGAPGVPGMPGGPPGGWQAGPGAPGGWGTQGPGGWPAPPAGAGELRMPSGLFPSGPPRPTYREPLAIRPSAVLTGAGAGALWMLLFGLLASTGRAYVWLTISAGALAWLTALALARMGDRGVAVGVAISSGLGVAIAGIVVLARMVGGHWLLW
jgi:hypothetical protein